MWAWISRGADRRERIVNIFCECSRWTSQPLHRQDKAYHPSFPFDSPRQKMPLRDLVLADRKPFSSRKLGSFCFMFTSTKPYFVFLACGAVTMGEGEGENERKRTETFNIQLLGWWREFNFNNIAVSPAPSVRNGVGLQPITAVRYHSRGASTQLNYNIGLTDW